MLVGQRAQRRYDQLTVDRALRETPAKVARITRVASYGSFFNFYLCQLQLDFQAGGSTEGDPIASLLAQIGRISIQDQSPRCRP